MHNFLTKTLTSKYTKKHGESINEILIARRNGNYVWVWLLCHIHYFFYYLHSQLLSFNCIVDNLCHSHRIIHLFWYFAILKFRFKKHFLAIAELKYKLFMLWLLLFKREGRQKRQKNVLNICIVMCKKIINYYVTTTHILNKLSMLTAHKIG